MRTTDCAKYNIRMYMLTHRQQRLTCAQCHIKLLSLQSLLSLGAIACLDALWKCCLRWASIMNDLGQPHYHCIAAVQSKYNNSLWAKDVILHDPKKIFETVKPIKLFLKIFSLLIWYCSHMPRSTQFLILQKINF